VTDYPRSEAKAAARERFRGLWAATTTPFDDAGRLDEAGLAADMDRLTGELGVDGVFCAGVMSEFWALSGAERHRLVTAVVTAARGKCQAIAHTGHHSVTETIELTRHAEAAGAPYLYQVPGWRPMRQYTELALAGNTAGAAEVAATLEPVRAVAHTWLHGPAARRRGSPVPYIKAWAGLLGMSGGPVRPPLTQVLPAELAALAADLDAAGLRGSARSAS
jgi:dihydrodipicolinate synthase/N-acetylneuraminate lyase